MHISERTKSGSCIKYFKLLPETVEKSQWFSSDIKNNCSIRSEKKKDNTVTFTHARSYLVVITLAQIIEIDNWCHHLPKLLVTSVGKTWIPCFFLCYDNQVCMGAGKMTQWLGPLAVAEYWSSGPSVHVTAHNCANCSPRESCKHSVNPWDKRRNPVQQDPLTSVASNFKIWHWVV